MYNQITDVKQVTKSFFQTRSLISDTSVLSKALALEWAALGGGGVTIPGRPDESPGRGTECYGLIDMMVLGHQLGSMVLEIFFKLNESMILWSIEWFILYSQNHRRD